MNDLYPDIMPNGVRLPHVFAYDDGSGVAMRWFCRYCGRFHTHGAYPEVGASNGHRVAHCVAEDSPYLKNGVFVVELDYPLPEPTKRYRVRYTRDGRIVSGYLRAVGHARWSHP
jgi:hypothetical protein